MKRISPALVALAVLVLFCASTILSALPGDKRAKLPKPPRPTAQKKGAGIGKLGKALRACAQDPEAAALQGINIRNMTMLAMALAGASAGLAGALMAPIAAITPYMGHGVVLIAFIVVVVGGMASIGGAVIAAIILGFIHTFVATLTDSLIATMVGVGFMAVTLVVRPQGLLGREKP